MLNFLNDLKLALRSLARTKGLAITVVLTLALGIGANAAIVTLVRGVLLRPLVNREEDRLVYIRQSAPRLGVENARFQFPNSKTCAIASRPSPGSATSPPSDSLSPAWASRAAGAAVLTYRFWTTVLKSDPSVLNRSIRLGTRQATVVGVLEPSVPYPAETELMANVVTSPHHLSATMVTGRVHRMTELFGRLAPGVDLETARAELRAVYASMVKEHPEAYSKADSRIEVVRLAGAQLFHGHTYAGCRSRSRLSPGAARRGAGVDVVEALRSE